MADRTQMEALLEHLKLTNEFQESCLDAIRSHYSLNDEIARAEERKK